MKLNNIPALLTVGFLAATAPARPAALDWSLLNDGGVSASADYAFAAQLSPIHSQPMTSSDYRLVATIPSPVFSTDSPEAPPLSITAADGLIRVSWPSSEVEFVLESAPLQSLTRAWNRVPQPYGSDATGWYVFEPVDRAGRFYRLVWERPE